MTCPLQDVGCTVKVRCNGDPSACWYGRRCARPTAAPERGISPHINTEAFLDYRTGKNKRSQQEMETIFFIKEMIREMNSVSQINDYWARARMARMPQKWTKCKNKSEHELHFDLKNANFAVITFRSAHIACLFCSTENWNQSRVSIELINVMANQAFRIVTGENTSVVQCVRSTRVAKRWKNVQ